MKNLIKKNTKIKALAIASILSLFSTVNAELPMNINDRVYFGGAFGVSEASNYCAINSGCEDKDSSWKAFAGYNINEIFSAEAAYTNIGDLHKNGTSSDISALSVSAVGNLNVTDQMSVFAKAGFSSWKSKNTDSDKSGTGLSYGVGAKVSLSETMKLRAEWEHLPSIDTSNTEESDINMMSVGVELSTL